MSENQIPYLRGSDDGWDWWGENPAEIVLVIFLLVIFFFFHALPPQGWGIEAVAQPGEAAPGADVAE